MNAIAKTGVAKLRIGIDTNTAMIMPARKTITRIGLAHGNRFRRRAEAHGGEVEIFAAQEIGACHEQNEETEAREQHEGQRDKIDQQRQQRDLDAFDDAGHQRQCGTDRIGRIVLALDRFGDIVDEKAADQR